jgi:hypothetical protein
MQHCSESNYNSLQSEHKENLKIISKKVRNNWKAHKQENRKKNQMELKRRQKQEHAWPLLQLK